MTFLVIAQANHKKIKKKLNNLFFVRFEKADLTNSSSKTVLNQMNPKCAISN
jgi:ribosomal protein L23